MTASRLTVSTIIDCSDAQIVPLSKVLNPLFVSLHEEHLRFVRCRLVHYQIAGVPEEYAALTIAFPPVAKIKFVSLFFINSLVACMVGVLMTETQPSGAPAAIAAFG